uniref:Cysteine rich secretory protein 3 n=1 Tax=Terrapene triunguis TaxID=2587831 RepID=A0A674INJ3_9SAUR
IPMQIIFFDPAPVYAALSTDLPEVQIEITDKHNALRRLVNPTARNMLKMVWNAEAAKNAKSWAEQCVYSHSPVSRRKVGNITCGENLYYSSVPKSCSSALQGWFDKRDSFTFGVGPTSSNAVTGHYTQMVWYKSYEIGCSFAFCPYSALYKYYYVCHYDPAGNVVRSATTPYKKGDPCGDCPDACDNGLCSKLIYYLINYAWGNVKGCHRDKSKTSCGLTVLLFKLMAKPTLISVGEEQVHG